MSGALSAGAGRSRGVGKGGGVAGAVADEAAVTVGEAPGSSARVCNK